MIPQWLRITVQSIINTIVGYNQKNGEIFEIIKNYYGIVKYQNHDTPYCHMLVWIHGVPDLITLHEKLKNEDDFC